MLDTKNIYYVCVLYVFLIFYRYGFSLIIYIGCYVHICYLSHKQRHKRIMRILDIYLYLQDLITIVKFKNENNTDECYQMDLLENIN